MLAGRSRAQFFTDRFVDARAALRLEHNKDAAKKGRHIMAPFDEESLAGLAPEERRKELPKLRVVCEVCGVSYGYQSRATFMSQKCPGKPPEPEPPPAPVELTTRAKESLDAHAKKREEARQLHDKKTKAKGLHVLAPYDESALAGLPYEKRRAKLQMMSITCEVCGVKYSYKRFGKMCGQKCPGKS